eukprot:CAMPEP_0175985896 /NCGR_PEP_ID=MMETSP0108-20121206/49842_1 /TAXON_ID=195067 ORGANISM="Goniomonas pacifica, Strain CCMP1869" /NCGR_SAMPLE_ID=MMETSP0108 /ASSEMBLY_ACC=CAM_ASM_000204 /LENGTH=34 /DNA_ID= /DNA_START= /DNA_END= /DNA_ORIENTATION=
MTRSPTPDTPTSSMFSMWVTSCPTAQARAFLKCV